MQVRLWGLLMMLMMMMMMMMMMLKMRRGVQEGGRWMQTTLPVMPQARHWLWDLHIDVLQQMQDTRAQAQRQRRAPEQQRQPIHPCCVL